MAEVERVNNLVQKLESDKATLLKTNDSLRSQVASLEKVIVMHRVVDTEVL